MRARLAYLAMVAVLIFAAQAWADERAVTRPLVHSVDPELRATVEAALRGKTGRHEPRAWALVGYEAARARGWLWAGLRWSSAGDTLYVRPGTRGRLQTLRVAGADSLAAAFTQGFGFRPGEPFAPTRWEERCARGVARLAEAGYPFASVQTRSMDADPTTGEVHATVWLASGAAATVEAVRVVGATHTRPDVLRRLAGIPLGRPYRESNLKRYAQRLAARDVVDEVVAIHPEPFGQGSGQVALRVEVRQPRTTGRVSAALGVIRNADQDTRVSGSVDLALFDLFGTARQFHGNWLDDGERRRRLDLRYLEPTAFNTSLDLMGRLGQRHEDDQFDMVLGDLSIRVPWRGDRRLEVGLGLDRTTFSGESGRVRSRRRATAGVGLGHRRDLGRGFFGSFETTVAGARVSERTATDEDTGQSGTLETTSQTIVEADGRLGFALSRLFAVELRGAWRSVSADRFPLPLSEQWYVGGATTVRGYREEQFHGDRAAWGGLEVVAGPARSGQMYAFFDLGWVSEKLVASGERDEHLRGFGLGLRSPVTIGRIDVSLGFAERLSFDVGKLHLSLTQEF